ncbi:MAG: DUF47 family protein [Desulfobacterales bacterium]|nr:DUF47 family protein [Desulfobacterales bacterium]
MLKFLFRKQRQIEALIYEYLDNLSLTQKNFAEALDKLIAKASESDFDFLIDQTHKFESKADDIREEIKSLMYSKALLPESRGDIMELLEAIDEIPRRFELILHMIQLQKLVIPDFIVPDIKELIKISLESCDLMIKEIKVLFKKDNGLSGLIAAIDGNESLCDHIERHLITHIFTSDLDPFHKLQLKEIIIYMGDISDQADRVSKQVNIIRMKRQV